MLTVGHGHGYVGQHGIIVADVGEDVVTSKIYQRKKMTLAVVVLWWVPSVAAIFNDAVGGCSRASGVDVAAKYIVRQVVGGSAAVGDVVSMDGLESVVPGDFDVTKIFNRGWGGNQTERGDGEMRWQRRKNEEEGQRFY